MSKVEKTDSEFRDQIQLINQLIQESNNARSTGKEFRMQTYYVFLTYKTHLDKPSYIDWFMRKFPSKKILFIRLAHENGDSSVPYEHTHVLVHFDNKNNATRINVRKPDFFDYSGIHPHILPMNKNAFTDCKRYIAKEDPENSDLKEGKTNIIEKIVQCSTIDEALRENCNTLRDATAVIAVYDRLKPDVGDYRTKFMDTDSVVLRPWQQELHDIVVLPPHDRQIIWIYDKAGNNGKNYFAEYMETKYSDHYLSIENPGKSADAAEYMFSAADQHRKGIKGIFVNYTRATANTRDIYSTLEGLKDGRLQRVKYHSKSIRWDKCHIIVAANWMPLLDGVWSPDRYCVYKIEDSKLVHIKVNPTSSEHGLHEPETYDTTRLKTENVRLTLELARLREEFELYKKNHK